MFGLYDKYSPEYKIRFGVFTLGGSPLILGGRDYMKIYLYIALYISREYVSYGQYQPYQGTIKRGHRVPSCSLV